MNLEEYLRNKYSESTFYSNLFNIRRFTEYYGKRSENATYKEVLNYIEHLRKNYDLSPRTLKHCLSGVKIYFNYLLATGKRNDHPCSELYLKDKIDKRIQVDTLYSMETLEQLYESYQIKRKKELSNRNKIIISLLIYQALTVGEIVSLEVSDIDLEKGEIYIKGSSNIKSKSPKSRTLSLKAKQVLLIYTYLQKDRKAILKRHRKSLEEPRFIIGQYGEAIKAHGITRIINQYQDREAITPIKIRQSVIAHLMKKENDARVVQEFAGHRKVSTTLQYSQSDLEILQKAIEHYHPLQ